MKKQLLFCVLTILCIELFSQTKNRFEFTYSLTKNSLHRNVNLMGGGSFEGKDSNIYSFRYQQSIFNSISTETGLEYSKNVIEIIPVPTGLGMKNKITNIEMLSVPIFRNIFLLMPERQ